MTSIKGLRLLRTGLRNPTQEFVSIARPITKTYPSRPGRTPQALRNRFQHPSIRQRRPYSDTNKPQYNPTPNLNSPQPSLTLRQRFRKLSREYGWSAFGVYLLLTALDFPFCFAAVRYLGTDRIGHYEHVILERIKILIPETVKESWRRLREKSAEASPLEHEGEMGSLKMGGLAGEKNRVEAYGVVTGEQAVGVVPGYDHGVKEAEQLNKSENASIWTQLALAYAIHKTFIFIRIPLTIAVTPKVVKVLRGWGWDIGKRRPKGTKGIKDT